MRPIIAHIIFVTLAACFCPGNAIAQTVPVSVDFSGVWQMDNARSEAVAQDQPVSDVVVAISQTGSILKVETTRDGTKDTAIYPIGEPPTNTTEVTGKARAFWEGPVLVDEGSLDVNGKTIGFREARTAASDGSEMIVETTLKVEHGYEVKGSQTIVSGKNVFVRRR